MPNLHTMSSYCIFELIYIYSSACISFSIAMQIGELVSLQNVIMQSNLTDESKEKAFEILKKAKQENIWDSRDP
jgi:hypothetical protein